MKQQTKIRPVWFIIILCSTLWLVLVTPIQANTSLALTPPGELWVNALSGNDTNTGQTAAVALRTLQKAADLAQPGTIIHILPGIYRETIRPAMSGTADQPIQYVAENGPGTVIIRGSEPSSALTWNQLTANTIGLPAGVPPLNIYYADLSTWGLTEAPRFVMQLDNVGQNIVARLPLAREPDEKVVTEWKYHEFWWAADGGWDAATCNPLTTPKCDISWRSTTQLTDRTTDREPAGIEPGNLSTLTNLVGGTLVAMDNQSGHYVYRRTITAHDPAAGRITIDPPVNTEPLNQLGWGSKYYVENKPSLLDTPGEWWYDTSTKRLYLWPPTAGNPSGQKIEISRRSTGFDLSNRSYITLNGLTLEFLNGRGLLLINYNSSKSYDDRVSHVTIRYASYGIYIEQDASGAAENITSGFTVQDSEIAYIDNKAFYFNYYWDYSGNDPATYTRAGIANTVIQNNDLHHLSFRPDNNAGGSLFLYADKLRFEGNHVHHIAHNGIQFSYAVSNKTGDILIKDNIFEQACQNHADCGALKFWGDPPDRNIFRNVLVTGNVFRNTFGWTYISEKRNLWGGRGQGGFGFYTDWASGFQVYRNIAYNNGYTGFQAYGTWRDGDMLYYNNIAANSPMGFSLDGLSSTANATQTVLRNNIIVNNQAYGILISDPSDLLSSITTIKIDYNLYYGNGWDNGVYKPGTMAIYRSPNSYYQSLANIQANTTWERYGRSGDPHFLNYNLNDHNPYDNSWPDFHLTPDSANAIDEGTAVLPTSLTTLLNHFGVNDRRYGSTFDIGYTEMSTTVTTPTTLFFPLIYKN